MTLTKLLRNTACLNAALAVCIATAQARDSEDPAEIIVTATKRAEILHDVSLAVAVIDGERLDRLSINTLDELTVLTPLVTVTDAQAATNLFMRGVGSGQNYGFEQSVGIFIDGVHYSRGRSARGPFFDLERVEVLKGPQSVLFGKNVVAGAFSLVTRKPTEEWEGNLTGAWTPKYDGREFSGFASGPLSDNLSIRLAGKHSKIDGYIDNTLPGAPNPGGREELVLRGIAQWRPTGNLVATFKAETSQLDVEGGLPVTPTLLAPAHLALVQAVDPLAETNKDYQTSTPGAGDPFFDAMFNDTNTENYTLTLEWELGDHQLTSVSSYIGYNTNQRTNNDHVNLNVLSGPEKHDFKSVAQEVRLASPGGGFFEYVIGAYYANEDLETRRIANADVSLSSLGGVFGVDRLGRNQRFSQDLDTWAIFAEATLNITDRFRLIGGARYTEDKKVADKRLFYSDVAMSVDEATPHAAAAAAFNNVFGTEHDFDGIKRGTNNFSPAVKLEYDVNDEMLVYGSYTQGFKAGGFDEDYLSDVIDGFDYEDEEVESFAAGTNVSLLGGDAYISAEFFHSAFTNLQVSTFSVSSFLVGNAAAATTLGVDIDGRWRVNDNLLFGGAFVWLDAEYDDYETGPCVLDDAGVEIAAFCDLSGERLQYAPETSGSFYANYNIPMSNGWEIGLYGDLVYSSAFATAGDLDPLSVQDSYVKLNATISLAALDNKYRLSLVAKNLTNRLTSHQANDIPLAVFFGGKGFSNFIDPPRMLTMQAAVNF